MARTINFEFRKGSGAPVEIMFGEVTLTPTLMHSVGTSAVIPAPTKADLVDGKATMPNVAPSPEPVAGQVEWAYKVVVKDRHGKHYEWLVGVPDALPAINFIALPRYSETKPPLFGQGEQGVPGTAATIAVGTVSSGPTPAVTNTGTSSNAVLNFTLAKGDKGDAGAGVPSGGSALQVIRKNAGNTTTEWATADKALVGLGNVDNTSDANKPVSTAQDTAIVNATSLPSNTISVTDTPASYPQGVTVAGAAVTPGGWPNVGGKTSNNLVTVTTLRRRGVGISGGAQQWVSSYDSDNTNIVYRLGKVDGGWTDFEQVVTNSELVKHAVNVNVRHFGAMGDGSTDDTDSFEAAFATARAVGLEVFVPKGRYYIPGNLDVSGLTIRGSEGGGYYNRYGSVILGNGTNTPFEQKQTNLPSITMRFHMLRFENIYTAIKLTYSIYSHFTDVSVVAANGDAVILGVNTIIGPIWNHLERCQFESISGVGLRLGGKDWHNNTVADICDFKGSTAGVEISAVGGYGAINNVFNGCELRGAMTGITLSGRTDSTKLNNCYMESTGPSVWVSGVTIDLQLNGNIYGSTVNTNSTGQPVYVHHASGTCSMSIYGGWITAGTGTQFDDMEFISSANPTALTLQMPLEPRVSHGGLRFRLFDPQRISEAEETTRGNTLTTKYATPTWAMQYPDGSRRFSISRNGSQGGADYGVYFRNDGNTAFVIANDGSTIFYGDYASDKTTPATTLGSVVRKMPIRNAAGVTVGYIPIYNTIT